MCGACHKKSKKCKKSCKDRCNPCRNRCTQAVGLSLVTTAEPDLYSTDGESILFTFTITNVGTCNFNSCLNICLQRIKVVDEVDYNLGGKLNFSLGKECLAPGQSTTFEWTYTTLISDVELSEFYLLSRAEANISKCECVLSNQERTRVTNTDL
jgi:hypothetical protein